VRNPDGLSGWWGVLIPLGDQPPGGLDDVAAEQTIWKGRYLEMSLFMICNSASKAACFSSYAPRFALRGGMEWLVMFSVLHSSVPIRIRLNRFSSNGAAYE
jgi:hypothetical protein